MCRRVWSGLLRRGATQRAEPLYTRPRMLEQTGAFGKGNHRIVLAREAQLDNDLHGQSRRLLNSDALAVPRASAYVELLS